MSQSRVPCVSVVVPCRNESGYIEACLESILDQEPPENGFEVIVADGMSTDGTRECLRELVRKDPRVSLIDNPAGIVPPGLNAAIRAAKGQIIIRMDAHAIYSRDYIRECVEVLNATNADNIGGPPRAMANTYLERAIAAAWHSPFAVGGSRFHDPNYEGYLDTVMWGCWRKEAFERFGYFDEELIRNQDDEHNLRIVRGGGKIFQSPRIRSGYYVRGSLRKLFSQYFQYGYWKVRVIQKHRLPASWRHLAPAAFLMALAASALVGIFWFPALWLLGGIGGAYAAAVITASLLTANNAGWKLLPILPIVFACFHFAYGAGFLRGLIDFVLLRKRTRQGKCRSDLSLQSV